MYMQGMVTLLELILQLVEVQAMFVNDTFSVISADKTSDNALCIVASGCR